MVEKMEDTDYVLCGSNSTVDNPGCCNRAPGRLHQKRNSGKFICQKHSIHYWIRCLWLDMVLKLHHSQSDD